MVIRNQVLTEKNPKLKHIGPDSKNTQEPNTIENHTRVTNTSSKRKTEKKIKTSEGQGERNRHVAHNWVMNYEPKNSSHEHDVEDEMRSKCNVTHITVMLKLLKGW